MYGISINGNANISDCTIAGFTYPYYFRGGSQTLSGNDIGGTTNSVVAVGNNDGSSATWHSEWGLPVYFVDNVRVRHGGTLRIDPGVEVIMNTKAITLGYYYSSNVNYCETGRLVADGVTFTGPGSVAFAWGGSQSVTNCEFNQVSVSIGGGGNPGGTISGCTFTNIATAILGAMASFGISNCNFWATQYGINNTGIGTVLAENNWWGATSGPMHATNPSGTGCRVSDRVDFTPWLGAPYGDSRPAFEIMYIYPEQLGYQWAGEEVRIHAIIKSNWGSGNLQLSGSCTYFLQDMMWLLSNQCFSMAAGEQYEAVFVTSTPPCPCEITHCAKEYDINVRLSDEQGALLVRGEHNDAFMVTSLTDEQISYYEQNIGSCWLDSWNECWMMFSSPVPILGDITSVLLYADKMCEAGRLRSAGLSRESDAAAFSGLIDAGFIVAGAATRGVRLAHMMVDVLDVTASAIESGVECMRVWRSWLGGDATVATKGSGTASPVDSLGMWFRVGMDSTQANVADALMLDGRCLVRVEADSSYADADSTGLLSVRTIQMNDSLAVSLVARGVRRFSSPDSANANSEATYILASTREQALTIGLLHRTAADTLEFLRYPELTVPDSARILLRVARDRERLPLEVDLDADGLLDFLWYPNGQQATAVPEKPISTALWQNAPNPFNPVTTIAFSLSTPSRVQLAIYDLAGRRVRVLVNGDERPAGRHAIRWDGTSNSGRLLASGIYFCRMEAGTFHETRRMTLVK
jgi:hypothetical protein